uniref:Putative secreted protein n=1 Tax=Rhipicephalus microplus TaxID=6941 RepID=A0A6G5A163_RHIMP
MEHILLICLFLLCILQNHANRVHLNQCCEVQDDSSLQRQAPGHSSRSDPSNNLPSVTIYTTDNVEVQCKDCDMCTHNEPSGPDVPRVCSMPMSDWPDSQSYSLKRFPCQCEVLLLQSE